MALFKGSFYEGVKPFDPPEDGSPPFRGLRARPLAAPEPILEHTVAVGDRLDALGQNYYANPRDWRRIADANPQEIFPEDLVYAPEPPPPSEVQREAVGEVVLIPRRREVR